MNMYLGLNLIEISQAYLQEPIQSCAVDYYTSVKWLWQVDIRINRQKLTKVTLHV